MPGGGYRYLRQAGGTIIGADINLKKDKEGRVEGRIGGAVFGKDLRMEVGEDYDQGRLGQNNRQVRRGF
ncbi:MAG: hypothetical protein L5655_03265 [Thermosediminibacteraceae bacterium]|nr:hypothetical protein [Thermosediminibacteraceae bacterium]